MMFWVIIVLLILLGLSFVVIPLLSKSRSVIGPSRVEANRALYESKFKELQFDLEKGLLDQNEYEETVQELQRTLLTDVEADAATQFKTGRSAGLIITLIIGIPVASILMYQQFSTGNAVANIQATPQATQAQSLQASIANLEQRLQNDPNNREGWKMLGQSYFIIQRFDKAIQAYGKASELANHADPDVMVLIAEASAYANNQNFGQRERELLFNALKINPQHERALWYLGYAEYLADNYNEATVYWDKLLALVPTDRPDVKETLVKFLNDARNKSGMAPIESPQVASVPATDTEQARTITVSVAISDQLQSETSPKDTLFIYARAADGPKMPLSLARLTVADLPAKVTLRKEMAMMQNMDLHTFDQVHAIARISKSGKAITQPGDLIAQSQLVDFTQSPSANISLVIDSVVK